MPHFAESAISEGPRPFYQRAGITLYHGDSREILPTLPTASVDVLLTDPPYGMRWQSGNRTVPFAPIAGDDGSLDIPAVLREALRALRHNRHLYVFGTFDLRGLPIGVQTTLIWDKCQVGLGNLSSPWGPSHEPITFSVKTQGDAEHGQVGALTARLRKGSVLRWRRPNGVGVTRHPTEKPLGLLRELIESSSRLGEIVLDPFSGSGATLVAAALEGRRAIGIELDAGYCEVTARRVDDVLDTLAHLQAA